MDCSVSKQATTEGKLPNSNLILVHQNIQSFPGKLLEIELFLEKCNVDILCVTEHWLQDYKMTFSVNNYKIASCFNRKSAGRGGSLILLKNNLKFKERKDIASFSIEQSVELSCVELDKYIIISVYRPPTADYAIFESTMEHILGKACIGDKKIVVCGDFNIDLLVESPLHTRIKLLFNSFNLFNVFQEPTRVTATSATCLDNVFCDCEFTDEAVINCLKSDHSGQMLSLLNGNIKKRENIFFRPVTSKRLESYKTVLEIKLPSINSLNMGANEIYNNFFKIVSLEFKNVFRMRKVCNNNKTKFSEWATAGIRKSRDTLYQLYDKKTFTHNVGFAEYVKNYSKVFKLVCHKAKCSYINKKIKDSVNKVKTIWTIINRESGKIKSRDCNLSIKMNENTLTSSEEVANAFEMFFTTVPIVATATLRSSAGLAENFLNANVALSKTEFMFSHIDPHTIMTTFKSLNLKKTEDLWGMSVKVVMSVIHILAPHLACIFNKCIEEGVFPDLMKCSKLIPLFKSGDREDPTNFRPISVLPTLSKVFEKIVLNQLLAHFESCGLLHSQQYGFTKGRSTTLAGVMLIKHIFSAWEGHRDAIGVFCDLSKAFDCVDHQTLLMKLRHYGLRATSLKLISSYLDNRIQKVEINNVQSSGSVVKIGVPQGSILGPFLFLVYINDLPYMVQNMSEIVLFADDTSLIFKINRQEKQFDNANITLSHVLNWFTANNLVLNSKKTKCIKFTLPNVRAAETKMFIDKDKLDLVEETVFLGITIDSKLQWGPHIMKLAHRLSSAAYAVNKIRLITDVATARLVYFSYFHSVMSYGILLWGRADDMQTIFMLQKRAIRFIYKLAYRESLRELFKDINILTVACQYIFENIMYVRKNMTSFKKNCDCHAVNTRNKNKLAVPKFRLSKVSTSFMGYCVRFYNKIPEAILNLSEQKFKKRIKYSLCKKAYYHIDEYLNDTSAWSDASSTLDIIDNICS